MWSMRTWMRIPRRADRCGADIRIIRTPVRTPPRERDVSVAPAQQLVVLGVRGAGSGDDLVLQGGGPLIGPGDSLGKRWRQTWPRWCVGPARRLDHRRLNRSIELSGNGRTGVHGLTRGEQGLEGFRPVPRVERLLGLP